jgi:beta-lactamase regulating signal transducer with metallopeptidase domain
VEYTKKERLTVIIDVIGYVGIMVIAFWIFVILLYIEARLQMYYHERKVEQERLINVLKDRE